MYWFRYVIHNNAVWEFWHYTIDILLAKEFCSPLSTSNAMPGAQGYYVSIQHKILGNSAAKSLSCIIVWNVMWTLALQRYIKWQICATELWLIIRIPAGDVTAPHLHSKDRKTVLFFRSSSRAYNYNSTMQIRAHSPTQCSCNIKLEYLIVWLSKDNIFS